MWCAILRFCWLRVRRWLKRHRTAVTALVATLSVASAILAFFTVRLNEKNAALEQANRHEKAAREEAEHHLGRNLAHLEGMLRFASFSRQLEAIRREPEFVHLLAEVAGQFDQLTADAPQSERARVKPAHRKRTRHESGERNGDDFGD